MGLSAGLKGPASAMPPYPGIIYRPYPKLGV